MGQTGFCGFLRKSAVSCGFCENLRFRNAVIPRKGRGWEGVCAEFGGGINIFWGAEIPTKFKTRYESNLVCPTKVLS